LAGKTFMCANPFPTSSTSQTDHLSQPRDAWSTLDLRMNPAGYSLHRTDNPYLLLLPFATYSTNSAQPAAQPSYLGHQNLQRYLR
jgi:hypothetical protein